MNLHQNLLSMLNLFIAALYFLCASAFSSEVVVVVNASNMENISPEMIKQIYSDKRNFWKNGHEILLFELPVKDKSREKFSSTLLNKSAIASQSDWSNRYVKNTIKNTVKIKPHKLVAKFVSRNKYAIGYVPADIAKRQSNIRIIMIINE